MWKFNLRSLFSIKTDWFVILLVSIKILTPTAPVLNGEIIPSSNQSLNRIECIVGCVDHSIMWWRTPGTNDGILVLGPSLQWREYTKAHAAQVKYGSKIFGGLRKKNRRDDKNIRCIEPVYKNKTKPNIRLYVNIIIV